MSVNIHVHLHAQESILINYQFLTRYRQAALILVYQILLVSSQRTFSYANTMCEYTMYNTFQRVQGFCTVPWQKCWKIH